MKKLQIKAVVLALSAAMMVGACSSDQNRQHAHHGGSDSKTFSLSEAYPDYSEVSAELKSHVQALTAHYIELKDALVQTDAVQAKEVAAKLVGSLSAFVPEGLEGEQKEYYDAQLAKVQQHAEAIEQTGDVEKQREAFLGLTQGIYAFVKTFDASQDELYFQYCPMAFGDKGAGWISDKKEIRNPYFGDKMLKCGKVKETL
jgi:hypothetical protein